MPDSRGRSAVVPLALAAALVLVAAAGGVALGAVPLVESLPEGDALLDRVEDRYESAESVVGEATVTVANDSASAEQAISFVLTEDNRTRIALNRSGHPYVLATNGTVAWVHNTSSGRLLVREVPANRSAWNDTATALSENGSGADSRSLTGGEWWAANGSTARVNVTRYVEENVTAETLRTETVGDTETYVVELRHVNASVEGTVALWVAQGSSEVVRLRAARGDNRTTVAFDDQRFNVSVHDSEFRPPTEAAATVDRIARESYSEFDAARAATALALRRPGGDYAFERAVVTTRGERTLVAAEYRDADNRTVTVLATADALPGPTNATAVNGTAVTVAGRNATLVEARGQRVVIWEGEGVTRAVAADLPRDTLLSVADRVRSDSE